MDQWIRNSARRARDKIIAFFPIGLTRSLAQSRRSSQIDPTTRLLITQARDEISAHVPQKLRVVVGQQKLKGCIIRVNRSVPEGPNAFDRGQRMRREGRLTLGSLRIKDDQITFGFGTREEPPAHYSVSDLGSAIRAFCQKLAEIYPDDFKLAA